MADPHVRRAVAPPLWASLRPLRDARTYPLTSRPHHPNIYRTCPATERRPPDRSGARETQERVSHGDTTRNTQKNHFAKQTHL